MMGGNVFDFTSRVSKNQVEPTLFQYQKELNDCGFPIKFELTGSAGKKDYSNDIDLIVDSEQFQGECGGFDFLKFQTDPVKYCELVLDLEKRARTSTLEQLSQKAFLICLSEAIGERCPNIRVAPRKKVGISNIFTAFPQYQGIFTNTYHVQIDWIVGDPKWLRFSTYSERYEGNIKGLHRTQFLIAMFANKGLVFNHGTGVKDKATGTMMATTPEQAVILLNRLYDLELTIGICADFYTLVDRLFPGLEEYVDAYYYHENIIKTYLQILDKTKCDVPRMFWDHWFRNFEEWGLTGKFIPDDSYMMPYLKEHFLR
jgi:hypothetical protein